ncbi:glycosyltransferase [candidate division KSB1 bacterium]|nr:glycosyltransferase [candidate division KSB1 bacterium]
MSLSKKVNQKVTKQQLEKSRNEEKISVIAALYNQKEIVASLCQNLIATFRDYKNCEFIFVDDGSSDSTFEALKNLAATEKNIKIVKLRTRFGESSALDAGFKNADGEYIVFFTVRVNINPAHLGRLVTKLQQGDDVVIGVRSPRRDSWLNRFVSRVFNTITNRMTTLHLHDINSGVLAVRRAVLQNVPFYGALNAFIPVLASRQGYRITEEKIEQMPGHFDQSMYPTSYIRRLLDLISVVFLSKYSKKPLHFLGFIGAIFTIIGLIINVYLFTYRILGLISLAGKPMLLLGTILLIIGIQMISIGLLGEMIIFTHAKEIKEYNIEEIID